MSSLAQDSKPQVSGGAMRELVIRGARTHNLRDISLGIPHDQLTVITGVSGSGKSSLAFDTIYAEGQRQYIESLSTYARQFLHQLQRPDVDDIQGLQPTLCIDQRASAANPRSTVATVTEVYDYLRLMMARLGTPHCFTCGQAIVQQSPEEIVRQIGQLPAGTRLVILAPMVRGRRGAHLEAIAAIRKKGLVRARVDGQLYDIESIPELAVRKNHTIEAVVDKIAIRQESLQRVADSVATALGLADGLVAISYLLPDFQTQAQGTWHERLFSTRYACASCGSSFAELEPRTFSFNSPYGACSACAGMGRVDYFDPELLDIHWERSAADGAFSFLKAAPRAQKARLRKAITRRLNDLGLDWDCSLDKLKPKERDRFLNGTRNDSTAGLYHELEKLRILDDSATPHWLDQFRSPMPCPACSGSRLRREALSVLLDGKSIADIGQMDISQSLNWIEALSFPPEQQPIANPILRELTHRLRFLSQVGVGYLTLSRSADTLSGGELQRVRLASSIGTGLVGVCYILDEPSIGLHQRDNDRLIESLRNLQKQGNTVIVVEHDEAMMRAADWLIDMGPGAGPQGGEIVVAGNVEQVVACPDSLTAAYLRGDKKVQPPQRRRTANPEKMIRLTGSSLNNLKNVSAEFPVGLLVGVTGVSGSGKSSLINQTLVPAILKELGQGTAVRPGPFKSLSGIQHIDKLIELTQSPIGRTPRSTPATYCGVFDLIRAVWAGTREAKSRGFSASRFSFNAGTGRCATCQGQGQEKIEMNFLPDLYVTCSACNGLRYNRQTLQIRYRNKSIADALNMSVDEAADFFCNFEKISRLLKTLQHVGLGYLSLGQNSNTLSGGEAQRIKLATELARTETGKTIYFLDEPTNGLHFEDVRRLILVMDGLVDRGNTVIVIEHNLDVIRSCDWLIDMGPEGGPAGGAIVAAGPPEAIAREPLSLTGGYV